MASNYIERLRTAIRQLHGVESEHLRSAPVHESFRGQTVWKGDVEVFRLIGHPAAQHCYAWTAGESSPSHESEQFIAVLGIPPINAPVDAVRAAIVASTRK